MKKMAIRPIKTLGANGRRPSADLRDWLVAAARRVGRTEDAPAIVVEAVRRAEMDPKHLKLNKLMK